jgi:hypothetical protein
MLNHKRIMSLALAGVMAASLAVPAFAATEVKETENRALQIDGTYKAVDIAVAVPSTGSVTINPYALPCEIVAANSTNNIDAVTVKNQQIATSPMAIKNQSDINLDVNVSYTASVKGSLTFASAPISDIKTDTKNEAFVYLVLESDETLSGGTDDVTDNAINAAYAAKAEAGWTEYVVTSGTAKTAANTLAIKATTSAISGGTMGTLKAATLGDDGTFSEYNAGSIAFVGLSGQCAQSPKTAWTAKDGMSVTIAFTFTPNTTADNTEVEEPED